MDLRLKYGDGFLELSFPADVEVEVLAPAAVPGLADLPGALKEALDRPLGLPRLEDMLSQKRPRTIAIAVPDESRPTPVAELVSGLLGRIFAASSPAETLEVTIVVGGGLHQAAGSSRLKELAEVAPLGKSYRVLVHDARRSAVQDYGKTSRGTPVSINQDYARADFKVVVGQVDPHQFVGFTGGAKGVVVGCAAAATIEHNHGLMFADGAEVGKLEGNPVREDMNEAGRLVGIDLAVNVVLDGDKQSVWLGAGEPEAVLRAGAQVCAAVYGVVIKDRYDIVIASCGGHPKDVCLYQAQKGLNLASQAVREGGKILLLASCPQGIGDDIYFNYVTQFASSQEVLEDFRRQGFRMGAHKAYLFGRTLADYDVAVASDLDPGILQACHLRAADPMKVVREWLEEFEGKPRVAVVPNANTTYFIMASTKRARSGRDRTEQLNSVGADVPAR